MSASTSDPPPSIAHSDHVPVKFLIVEALEQNLLALCQAIQRDGLQLITATTGRSALELLAAHDFALAIIAVQLPDETGFELAASLPHDIPFIFVADGLPDDQTRLRAYNAGAVDYLHIPIEPNVLRRKTRAFFELAQQRQQIAGQLVSAERAKDEFLANLSHEIRTPMNAVLGMTELVLDTPLADDQRRLLQTARSAGLNLLATINDLLDFSRIEADALELEPAAFSLRASVAETVSALAIRAHRKGLEVVCDIQPDVPDQLIGDAGRLRQVLVNLVGNAIKFTAAGEIVITVSRDAAARVLFSVRDTGIGIPRSEQRRIFRAFEQEDMTTTRRYGGTGLGLTIAARLIGLMGGEVRVESEPERGSNFSFALSFATVAGANLQRENAQLPAMRVLVVDDNATARDTLASWLRAWNLAVDTADGYEAATIHLRYGLASNTPFAVVLLDAGVVHAERLRADPAFSHLWIILLDQIVPPSEAAHPVHAHLYKPVMRHTLYEAMRNATGAVPAPAPVRRVSLPEPSQRPRAKIPLRVLVAEDHEFNLDFLQTLLATRGHHVEIATTGRAALASIAERPFDLMLLDLHLPELDGFQVIKEIRAAEAGSGRHMPVIAVTARSRAEDRVRCLEAGMDDFLTKPISAATLWAVLERVAASLAPDQPAQLVTPSVLLAACGADQSLLARLCRKLAQYLPTDLAALEDAVNARDAARVREKAHRFAGMLAAFSNDASKLALDIEARAAEHRLDAASALLPALQKAAAALLQEIAGLSVEELEKRLRS